MRKETESASGAERASQGLKEGAAELLAAASAGNVEQVQTLAERGLDLNATDAFGNTALIYAAAGGHLALVRWLVTSGVKVNARNQIGITALQRAATQGYTEIVALLKKHAPEDEAATAPRQRRAGNGSAALLQAARDGNLREVRAWLASGADVNAQNEEGWTTLMIATLKGHKEIVQALLQSERVEVNARNHHGWTALRFAVSMSDTETMRMLLAAGADVDAPDRDGSTALMQAAGEGNLECAGILLAAGADSRAKNGVGEMAAEIAAHRGFPEIVRVLEKFETEAEDSVIVKAEAKVKPSARPITPN